MNKLVPLHCLVVVVGPTPKENSLYLKNHFPDYEVINAEEIRYELTGDTERRDIDSIVFSEIHRRIETKLNLGERVVVNAANLRRDGRVALANIGLAHGVPVFYLICVNGSVAAPVHQRFLSAERDVLRGDGIAEVIDSRVSGLTPVKKIGFQNLDSVKERFSGITVIGDIHGMYHSLLAALDWARARHHFVLFLGDVIDYGPGTLECADEVYKTVMRGKGELIIGNHERKIARWIDQPERGRHMMRLSEGNRVTVQALNNLGNPRRDRWMARFKGLVARSPLILELDNYVFTHAAIHPDWWTGPEDYKNMENFSLFGEFEPTASRFTEANRPHRTYNWVKSIPAGSIALVGHDALSFIAPMTQTNEAGGRAVFLDTGSGKGGYLSSVDLRFTPEGPKMENFTRH
jgi:hypothetical protein